MSESAMRRFIEESGLLFDELGSSRMTGRVLAFLLTCEPAEQSSEALAEGLGVSRGSISTATRQLVRLGLVRRSTQPGSRALFFRLEEGAWIPMMEVRMRNVTRLRQLAERGLDAVAPASPSQQRRLEEMRDFYAYFEERVPELVDEWLARQGKARG